jgi:eukaryotic-like serine/threonine-protein kinase
VADEKRTKIGATGPVRVQPTGAAPTPAEPAGSPPIDPESAQHPTTFASGPPTGEPGPASYPQIDHSKSYLPPVPTGDPLIGVTLVGRYLIEKKLGEGGMGAVYLATHQLLEKKVALKVLHNEFARKPDLVERFMQEAKSASRIRHENVIDISDFGTTPDGLVFFAMELLEGHDLHEEVARARLAGQLLPYARSKKIFLQICSALSAAHARGIVHRDLKPENVYLVEFLGDPDFVKLLDFGIAKLTEVNEEGRKLTRTGMLFGTPEYMSPEQARGEHVDHRVDVYAMGCILFQLLTGRVPFEADNFMGVLSLHLTEPPPMIPEAVFDRIGAPRELAQVVDRALAKDRAERFQTIDELANAVRVVSGDPPVEPAGAAGSAPVARPASVPAPAVTKEARTPTPPPETRRRTQWTGSLKVPEAEAPAQRSKLPLILGGVVIAAVAAVAIVFATRGGGGEARDPDRPIGLAHASGSDGAEPGSGSQPVIVTPTPDAAAVTPEPAPPAWAEIKLDSVPSGATVTDLSSNPKFKTPKTFKVKGSNTPRQFQFALRGYRDSIVEIVPNEATIALTEKLERGSGTVTRTPDPGPGSGSATRVGPGSAAGSGSAAVQVGSGSATVVVPKPPPVDDCDDPPCIKTHIPGLRTCSTDADCVGGQTCSNGSCK